VSKPAAFSIDSAKGRSIKACRRSCPIAIDRDPPEDQSSQDEFSGETAMTAEIDNLALEHLRAIRADIADIKRRLERLELHDEH
jgi:hypothetical protein